MQYIHGHNLYRDKAYKFGFTGTAPCVAVCNFIVSRAQRGLELSGGIERLSTKLLSHGGTIYWTSRLKGSVNR